MPAGAATDPEAFLGSVSCASAGNCSAVGGYTDSSGHSQGVLLSESSGTWATGVKAGLPADAATNPFASVDSVSCPSAGNCSAVGGYADCVNNQQGLLLSESSGTWATGVAAGPPASCAVSPPPGGGGSRTPPSNTITLAGAKLNRKKGTATIPVTVPGPGTLTLTGKGVASQRPVGVSRPATAARTVSAPGIVNLLVKAKGKTKKTLFSTGKAKIKLTITFTPTGGSAASQTKTVKLKKTL